MEAAPWKDVNPACFVSRAQVEGLRKEYNTRSGGRFTAADGIDLAIQRGGMTALLGPSGSGSHRL